MISLLASIFLLAHVIINLVAATVNLGDFSTYKSNLETLLYSLPTKIDINGFYNASLGQNPDTVYASALCRGDVQLDACRECIQNTTNQLVESYPNKQAVIWKDFCTLRYSNESMFGILAESPEIYVWSMGSISSNPHHFMEDVYRLLDNISMEAAERGCLRKVAAGNTSTVDRDTVFSLVQCTPDLSIENCSSCLSFAISNIPLCGDAETGCRILFPSCNIRYEVKPFYNETRLQELQDQLITTPAPPSLMSPAPPSVAGEKDTRPTVVVIIIVSLAAGLLLSIGVGFLFTKRINRKSTQELGHDSNTMESLQFDFAKIREATNDFSDSNKLGEGGFGAVYKGELQNGQEIAVKRLSMDSTQGHLEFKNEVLLMTKLQHRNLVRLLGFSIEANERLLVYELVHNASLDKFIFDPIRKIYLNWEQRYNIIMGIARGLVYLHEESQLRIIHRDLKASNVLLDLDMNPKIADFGTARLFEPDETRGNTSRVVGTYGYMPPEYAIRGQFSVKLDVFSFGVMIMEIVTGQKNNSYQNEEDMNFLSCLWNYWHRGMIANMVDPILLSTTGSDIPRDMLRCIHIGLLCVQKNAADRPTMASVVVMLSSVTVTMLVPSEPAFFVSSEHNDNSGGLPSNSFAPSVGSSKADTLITILYPR
ncbi:cysteine-rich receptor-like protein kinase 8 isoform X2 [Henckelia pumila]|uniref:cysteine-rich receptor-like protein kinase 8 isoform X2 n=1 Tax=Henckelia pumila TaxID=405737 RepID=UPI003C6E345F